MRIGFIGGGTMAEAIVSGILQGGLARSTDVTVGEPLQSRRETIANKYGLLTTPDNLEVIKQADLVVLAVKPQTLPHVCSQIRGHLAPSQTLLSILAGVRLETLTRDLEHQAIVRSMPNTPAQVAAGLTVWIPTPAVDDKMRQVVRSLFQTLGKEIEMSDEKYLDMATAINGSGPAYLFTFADALIDAAVYLGFTRDTAHELVVETIWGSADLLRKTNQQPSDLRARVTSPGGTTAEALLELERGAFRATIINAVAAAYEKTRSLGVQI